MHKVLSLHQPSFTEIRWTITEKMAYNRFAKDVYSWPWPFTYVPVIWINLFPCQVLPTRQIEKDRVINKREIADCVFSSSVTLWPWPLTFVPTNVYSCCTPYYILTGQIWDRSDNKSQRNRRTHIVGKKLKKNKEKPIQQQKGLPTLSADLNEPSNNLNNTKCM